MVPKFTFPHLYHVQRDLLLAMIGLELEGWLNQEQFQTLWVFCEKFNIENLLTKILARKHLRLLDHFSAFVVIGDIGARNSLYYANCEEQIHDRRRVDWTNYGTQMAQQFYG